MEKEMLGQLKAPLLQYTFTCYMQSYRDNFTGKSSKKSSLEDDPAHHPICSILSIQYKA